MASVQKRGENSWLLVVEAGFDATGKRIKRTKTIQAEGIREARKRLAEFQTEVEAGEYIAPEKMTVAAFVEEWKQKHAEKDLSPLTFKTYGHHLKNHILPAVGHIRIDQVKTLHLVTFINDLGKPGARKDGSEQELSSRTIVYIYRVMQNIFKHAVDWQLLKKNPMDGTKKPKIEKKEMLFYEEEEEAQLVIQALYAEPQMWRLLCLGAMIGGFCRGELLAFEWTDVNYDEMNISVSKSISLTENGKAIVKDPKTVSSIRHVDMPEWFMRELREYHDLWKEKRDFIGDKWLGEDHNYIFHSGFGKPLYHTTPSWWWKQFIHKHGLKYIRFHDLRHSSATLLIETETDLKAIQKRLGHSQFQTTADLYAHVTKNLSRRTAEKFNKFDPKNISSTTRQQEAKKATVLPFTKSL